jgi:DNA primase
VSGKQAGGKSDLAPDTGRDLVGGDTRRIESKIIAMMLQFPVIIEKIINKEVLEYFSDPMLKTIGQAVVAHGAYTTADVNDIIIKIKDTKAKDLIAALSIQDDSWDDEGCRRLIAQFLSSRTRQQNDLLRKIKEAEENNNQALLEELLKQKQNQARDRQESNLTSLGG